MVEHSQSVPLITIGITCYNAADTIGSAVNSALNQNWPAVEIIIADDCSFDGSKEILRKIAKSHDCVQLIEHQMNLGCAAARNTILEAANGAFIAFFDDDDMSKFDRLTLQHAKITEHERKHKVRNVACYTSGTRTYPNGYNLPIYAVGSNGNAAVGTEMVDYLLFNKRRTNVFFGAGTPANSLMIRTTVLRNLGGFDTLMRRQEDADFAIRLGFEGGHFIGITDMVLLQFSTTGTEKSPSVEFESFSYILEKNKRYLIEKGWYDYMRRWSKMRLMHFLGCDLKASILLASLFMSYPLKTMCHFLRSGTQRFFHERKLSSK